MNTTTPGRAEAQAGLLFVMLAAVLWGTVGVTTKALYGVTATTPLSIGIFRLGIATPILWAIGLFALKGRMFQVPVRDLSKMALIGILMAFYQVSYFTAVQSLGAAVAALITLCTAPAMVATISAVVTKERLTRQILAAMACALIGTALLIQIRPGEATFSQSLGGVGWALASAFGYSAMVVVSRNLAGRYHPVQPFAIGLGFGALLLLIIGSFSGFVWSYPVEGWGLLVYLALVPTAIAFGIFLVGMQYTPATVASIATLLEPLTSTLLAWLLFNEQLSPLGFVGAILLCAAMLLLWRR